MFQCLYEVGRYRKITLLDLYCEMLKLEPHSSGATELNLVAKDYKTSLDNHHSLGCWQDGGYFVSVFQILRYTFVFCVRLGIM